MSISLAKLTSSIWDNSTSDPYLLSAPVASGVDGYNADDINRDYWDHCNFFTLNEGTALMASPSDPDLTYFWYRNVETDQKVELDFNGKGIFYQFSNTPINWTKRLDEATGTSGPYRSLYNEELNQPRATKLTYISPLAIGGGTEIGLYWQRQTGDKFFHVPAIDEHTIEGRTPYMWPRVDIAQIIWAWSAFHVASGITTSATDLLNKQSFIDYSEANWNDPLNTVVLDVWREAGVKQSEQIKSLIRQSGAWVSFMGGGDNGALDYKMRLVHHGGLATNTTTIDFDDLGKDALVSFPSMRYNDSLLVNQVKAVWGSFLKQDVPVDDVADNATSVELIQAQTVGDNANVIEDSNPSSTIVRGALEASLELKNVGEEDYASARIAINMERWADPVREIKFSMGPLHMDFDTGDIVKLSLDEYGLDETEFLVTEKQISLFPNPSADITAVEWKAVGSASRLDPSDSSLDDIKTFWYTTTSGLTVDGNDYVTSWADSSQRPVDYAGTSDAVVSGLDIHGPLYTASNADINGYPSIEFIDIVGSGCSLILNPDFADDTGILTTIESELWMWQSDPNTDQWGSASVLSEENTVAYSVFNITNVTAEYVGSGSQTLDLTFTSTTARDTFYDSVSKFWIGGYEFTVTDGTKSGNEINYSPTWSLAEMQALFRVQVGQVPDPGPGRPAFTFLYDNENDAIVYSFDHTVIAVVKPTVLDTNGDMYSVKGVYGQQTATSCKWGLSSSGNGVYAVRSRSTSITDEDATSDWQILTYIQRRGTFDRDDMNGTRLYKGVRRMAGAGTDNSDYYSDLSYDARSGFRVRHQDPATDGYPTIGADYFNQESNQFSGHMADILFFKDTVRPHELKKIIRYLGNKYGIDVENS